MTTPYCPLRGALAAISGGMPRSISRRLAAAVLEVDGRRRAGEKLLFDIETAVDRLLVALCRINTSECERIALLFDQAIGDADAILKSEAYEEAE